MQNTPNHESSVRCMPSPTPHTISPALTWAEINISALKNNISYLDDLSGKPFFILVIKANAYGHGMIDIARHIDTFTPVDAFAVARLDEGIALRQQGITKRIIVLSGVSHINHLKLCSEYHLEATIHTSDVAQAWVGLCSEQQANKAMPVKAWLKINTGMNRLGLALNEFLELAVTLRQNSQVFKPSLCGVLSHFSSSESINNPQNIKQKTRFNKAIEASGLTTTFPAIKISLSNSGGIFYHHDSHHSAVRSGISSYGLPPSKIDQVTQQLTAVMSLKTTIIAIHEISEGDSVGYNEQYTATQSRTIATLAAGYGDGYPRQAKTGTPVYLNSGIAKTVGRISMDLMSIDITGIKAAVNDEVELWGEHISCHDLAIQCDTISYELLTRVSDRVERITTHV